MFVYIILYFQKYFLMKIFNSIKFKVVTPVVAVIFFLSFISFYEVYKTVAKSSREQVHKELTQTVTIVANTVSSETEKEFTILKTLANIPQIRDETVDLYEKYAKEKNDIISIPLD